MNWFNVYPSDGDGLTRTVVTEVDLRSLPLPEWSDDELGFRLAYLYPEVDGYGHLTASAAVLAEVKALMDEVESRGYDPISNLRYNENTQGWGWLRGFTRVPN